MKIFSTDFKVPMFYTFLLFGCIVKYKFKLLNHCHKYSLKKVKRLEHQQFYEYGFFKDQWTKMFSAKYDQKKK